MNKGKQVFPRQKKWEALPGRILEFDDEQVRGIAVFDSFKLKLRHEVAPMLNFHFDGRSGQPAD